MPVFLLDWRYMDDLKAKQALETLAFFDVSGLPVAESAVKRWERGEIELSGQEWRTVLDWHASLGPRVSLRDETSIALMRQSRPWLRLLCAWPGVQAMFLCNSVAFMSATEHSDVDIFIVCRPGWLWSTRFVLTALLAVFGKRPKPGHEAGTICLSFFASADALDLHSITVENDIYLSYWLATLVPVFDPTSIAPRLLDANRSLLPNTRVDHLREVSEALVGGPVVLLARLLAWPGAFLVNLLRNPLKQWQMQRFPKAITDAAQEKGHHVVITDTMLKFHTTDRREEYKLAWKKRYDVLEKAWRARVA